MGLFLSKGMHLKEMMLEVQKICKSRKWSFVSEKKSPFIYDLATWRNTLEENSFSYVNLRPQFSQVNSKAV